MDYFKLMLLIATYHEDRKQELLKEAMRLEEEV